MAKKKDMPKEDTPQSISINDAKNILKKVQDKYGKMLVCSAADIDMKFMSTKVDVLDHKLGGGLLMGGQTLIYGQPGAGKSTLALCAISQAQKQGKRCLLVDQEGKFSPNWAAKLGVDLENLLIVRGETFETNIDAVRALLEHEAIDLVVIDSIAAVASAAEKYEKNKSKVKDAPREIKASDEDTVSLIARQVSKFNRLTSTSFANQNVCVIFISQVRADISLTGTRTPLKAQGGNSINHAVSVIMRVKDDKYNGTFDEEGPLVWATNYIIEKNQVNGKERVAVRVINVRDKGPDNVLTTLEYAKESGIISRSGAYYSFDSLRTQGWESFVEAVMDNPAMYDKIYNELAKQEFTNDKIDKDVLSKVEDDEPEEE